VLGDAAKKGFAVEDGGELATDLVEECEGLRLLGKKEKGKIAQRIGFPTNGTAASFADSSLAWNSLNYFDLDAQDARRRQRAASGGQRPANGGWRPVSRGSRRQPDWRGRAKHKRRSLGAAIRAEGGVAFAREC